MITCQECNSEISEIEAFCPYCGIKIDRPEPVAEPVPVVDESFESTIVITPSEAAIMRENIAADGSSSTEDSSGTLPVEDIPTPAILTSEYPSSVTDPNVVFGGDKATFESNATDEDPISGLFPTSPPSPLSPGETDLGAFSISEELQPPDIADPAIDEEPISLAEEIVDLPLIAPPPSFNVPEPNVDLAEKEVAGENELAESEVVSVPTSEDPLPEPEDGPGLIMEQKEVTEFVPTPFKESELFDDAAEESESRQQFVEEATEAAFDSAAPEPLQPADDATVPSHELPNDDEPVISAADAVEAPEAEAIDEPNSPELNLEPADVISKPADSLEDAVSTPSVFDSVRIMEGIAASGPPQPPANIQPIVTETVESTEADPIVTDPGTATELGASDTDGRKAAKLKPLHEGAVLNKRYEVVRKIGGGGMGAVYLASDNNLGGVLRAVKEMVQAHIEEEQQEKAINDFKRESTILSTLDHPSIPTIYDYFYDADEGRFYLVMKYISGGDLASKLRSSPDGKIDELTATEWALQITDVLNYLHNQPTTIVYRDLKPSNIMLDGNTGRAMLIDFGIARSISQKEEKGVTAVGTMGYAPPELFSGNVEPRSDIYSLGSTLFHLLTGADPQSNPLLIFDFQKNPRPRQINSRLSDQMEQILMRSVEYNADQRFASAAELKAVLEEHLANLRSGNLTYGVSEAPVSVSLANQSVFCGFCGQRIVATDMFCAFCGSKQPLAQQGVHSEIYRHASVTARLIIQGTSELSAPVFSLQKDESLIGRRDPMSNIFPEVDLSKYDPQTKISRRHAKIWRDGTAFMLEDLGSSNGTLVEGASANVSRLPAHQPFKLTSGDHIRIGDTSLQFVVG